MLYFLLFIAIMSIIICCIIIRDIIEIQIVEQKKKKWAKPTIDYFSNSYNVEKRIESLQRRIEKLRASYMHNPDDSSNALDILIIYKAELNRLEAKYNHILKLAANDTRTTRKSTTVY